jgi:CheY-like chemotaxis protein
MPEPTGGAQSQALNSLRLSQSQLNALLDKLDATSAEFDCKKREYVRYAFRHAVVILEVSQPGGNTSKVPVVSRNLSAGGISLLHSAYVYPGSTCAVWLPHPYLKWMQVEGTIVRCVHRGGRVHELGIRFDKIINTRDLLHNDALSEAYSMELVEPQRLNGVLLVVDDNSLEHALIDKLLKETNLDVRHAHTTEEAAAAVAKGCDQILCDYHLEGSTAEDVVALLTEQNLDTPMLLMTADKSPQLRERMRQHGAIGFVGKPLRGDRLLRALAEFMISDGHGGPIFSSLGSDNPAHGLVDQFVSGLTDTVARLQKSMTDNNLDDCMSVCRQLASHASPMGFGELGRIAEAALTKLASSMSVRESGVELRQLVSACKRVKTRAAA